MVADLSLDKDILHEALMETLNISSRNNVWVMLSRARQRLRQCLETNWFKA